MIPSPQLSHSFATIHQSSPLSVFLCSLQARPVRTADGNTKGGLPPVEFTIHLLPLLFLWQGLSLSPFFFILLKLCRKGSVCIPVAHSRSLCRVFDPLPGFLMSLFYADDDAVQLHLRFCVRVEDVCYSRYFELAPQQGWSIVFAAVCPCALSGFFALLGVPAGQLTIRAGWAFFIFFVCCGDFAGVKAASGGSDSLSLLHGCSVML